MKHDKISGRSVLLGLALALALRECVEEYTDSRNAARAVFVVFWGAWLFTTYLVLRKQRSNEGRGDERRQ